MVVGDLDVPGVTIGPDEADTILVVDPDGMLPHPIALQRVEPVRWRRELPEEGRCVQGVQLGPPSTPGLYRQNPPGLLAVTSLE